METVSLATTANTNSRQMFEALAEAIGVEPNIILGARLCFEPDSIVRWDVDLVADKDTVNYCLENYAPTVPLIGSAV